MSDTITTERLVMRPPARADFEDCAALWAHTDVVRYLGLAKPSTREEAWARLNRYVGHWAMQGYGFWAVRERDGGRYVGEIGVADFKRDLDPSLSGALEMGWILSPSAWGKGYATEAVRAGVAWCSPRFPDERLMCLIDPDNGASLRVAARCGFKEYARTFYKDTEVLLLERRLNK